MSARPPRADERPQRIIVRDVSEDGGLTWRPALPSDAGRRDVIERGEFADPDDDASATRT